MLFSVLLNFNKDDVFPPLQKLDSSKKSSFVPTLHHDFDTTKNALYAATKSLVWDELKLLLNDTILVNEKHKDLSLLNASLLHREALSKNDYTSTIKQLENGLISIETKMELGFEYEIPFDKYSNKLKFDGKNVECFGFLPKQRDFAENNQIQRIIYFDDDNFLIYLATKGDDQIALFKTEKHYSNLVELIEDIKSYNKQIRTFRDQYSTYWRTEFCDEDMVLIPMISFNLETHFPCFEGKSFQCGNKEYKIAKSTQSIAFVMDEKGVHFKSTAKDEIFGSIEKSVHSVPKKLIFDKPFYILLTKKNKKVPYFIAFIRNTELMIEK